MSEETHNQEAPLLQQDDEQQAPPQQEEPATSTTNDDAPPAAESEPQPISRSSYKTNEEMLRDQIEHNDALMAAVTTTVGEVEALEDQLLQATQDSKRPDKLAQNTANLKSALEGLNWDYFAKGKYSEQYVHDLLALRLDVEELLDQSVIPRYEKMKKVLLTLDEIANSTMVMDQYKEIAALIKEKVQAFEEPFYNSQVNIDIMDHDAFFEACDCVRASSEVSLEVLVRQVDLDIKAAVTKYEALIQTHTEIYDDEAARVAATSYARLRATHPEDECDPWEVAKTQAKVRYDSPVLQQYHDEDEADRVELGFQDEWYLKQRAAVATIPVRAGRVVREVDEAHYEQGMEILDEIISCCEKKGALIDQATKDTGEQGAIMLATLRTKVLEVEEAGRKFQEIFRVRRQQATEDMNTVTTYSADEAAANERAITSYEQWERHDLQWFNESDVRLEEERVKLIAQQKLVNELVLLRRDRAADALERKDTELKRRATHVEIQEVCAGYVEKLKLSLRNFELPEQYNAVTTQFPVQCEAAAAASTEKKSGELFALLQASVTEAGLFAAANYMAPNLGIVRKEAKAADLKEKANQARTQHEFCIQTKDPETDKHGQLEQRMIDLAQTQDEVATVLHARLDRNWAKYEALRDLAIKLECPLSETLPDPVETITQQIQAHATYVLRGPRAALINLDHGSQDRIVVPKKFFLDDSQFRAVKELPAGGMSPRKFIEN